MHRVKDLNILKKDFRLTVKATKKLRLEDLTGPDVVDDLIDGSIIPHLQIINKNKKIVTSGSCSGHSGYPFISVIFKDEETRDFYLKKFKRYDYRIIKSNDLRISFFDDNYSDCEIKEEWNIHPRRKCPPKQAHDFWDKCVRVLEVK